MSLDVSHRGRGFPGARCVSGVMTGVCENELRTITSVHRLFGFKWSMWRPECTPIPLERQVFELYAHNRLHSPSSLYGGCGVIIKHLNAKYSSSCYFCSLLFPLFQLFICLFLDMLLPCKSKRPFTPQKGSFNMWFSHYVWLWIKYGSLWVLWIIASYFAQLPDFLRFEVVNDLVLDAFS